MNDRWKQTLIQGILVTAVAVNLMFGALLIVNKQMEIPETTQPTTGIPKPAQKTDFQMELVDVSYQDNWRIEHYRKVEHLYDHQNNLVKKTPTSEMIYLRYWQGEDE